MSLQRVQIVGNLIRDAVLRYTPSGDAVCEITIGVTTQKGTGDNKKETSYFWKATYWKEQAEAISKRMHKGDLVFAEGELEANTFEKKDGGIGVNLSIRWPHITILRKKNPVNSDFHEAEVATEVKEEVVSEAELF